MDLSILIPAFNEEQRLLPTLRELQEYFSAQHLNYEIIVVNDGSTDNTSDTVTDFIKHLKTVEVANPPHIRLLAYPENQGKGFAVRFGAINAKGELLLLVDADGATPPAEFDTLCEVLKNGSADIVIGSRAISSAATRLETSFHRKYLGRAFNFVVHQLSVPELRKLNIQDTQCGFKLFSKKAYQLVFSLQTLSGFAFDCELLTIASLNNLRIKEVAVNWTNISGSKVNLLSDPFKMLLDLVRIRFQAMKGWYDELSV